VRKIPKIGFKHTEESKQKISKAVKEKLNVPEINAKLKNHMLNRWANPEERKKLCEKRKMYINEHPEVLEKLRESIRGKPAWNRGVSPSKETIEKLRIISKERFEKDPEGFYQRMCKPHIGKTGPNKGKVWDGGRKIKKSLSQLKDKNPNWKSGSSFGKWCPKFNPILKRDVRTFFGNVCVFCGKNPEKNKAELSVHHVYTEKMAYCEDKISEMDLVRKRLPKHIVRWEEPEFAKEEMLYIRMMVPLCKSCHAKQNSASEMEDYENTFYRKFFTELILTKYNGRCYTND
jgi:hypothetical protein